MKYRLSTLAATGVALAFAFAVALVAMTAFYKPAGHCQGNCVSLPDLTVRQVDQVHKITLLLEGVEITPGMDNVQIFIDVYTKDPSRPEESRADGFQRQFAAVFRVEDPDHGYKGLIEADVTVPVMALMPTDPKLFDGIAVEFYETQKNHSIILNADSMIVASAHFAFYDWRGKPIPVASLKP